MPGKPRDKRACAGTLQAVALLCAALAAAFYLAWFRVPPGWAPWGPVDLEASGGVFSRMQINSLAADPEACFAALAASKLEFERVVGRPLRDGCGIPAGVHVLRSHVPYNSSFVASCPLAAALYRYERELDALARVHTGSGLARIEHLGTYACRNVNSALAGPRSQHATANAIYIAGFRLEDGRRISVLEHWGSDMPAGRFLAEAHEAGCGLFNAVLGPRYNDLHANHFHLDLGRTRVCR